MSESLLMDYLHPSKTVGHKASNTILLHSLQKITYIPFKLNQIF